MSKAMMVRDESDKEWVKDTKEDTEDLAGSREE